MSSLLFPLLSSVFSTIRASQLNSLFTMILSDKLSFSSSIISKSLQIIFSIDLSIKLLLQLLIVFRPLLPKGTSLVWFDLSEQLREETLMCSDLQEKNWLSRKNEFDVKKRFSPHKFHLLQKKGSNTGFCYIARRLLKVLATQYRSQHQTE